MASITLRQVKGSPLTHTEVDNNFTNLNNSKLEITGSTGAAILPAGSTAQRPGSPVSGHLRFNSSTSLFEGYNGTVWSSVGGASLNNNTSTNASYYLTMTQSTSGVALTLDVSSTKLYFNPSTGTLNSTNFNSLSDARYKMDVYTLIPETSWGIIRNLRPVTFRWIGNAKRSFGFIAQELEQYLPELVETSDAGIKTVNYNGLIAILTSTIAHLEKRIEALENKQ